MSASVLVGVAALLWLPAPRGRRILMGIRKGSHGAGTWSFPGGGLEPGETVAECASRETEEEVGVFVHPSSFCKLTFTNDVFRADDRHYVTLYMAAPWPETMPEPTVMEPDKCDGWSWRYSAPAPLFLPVMNLLNDGFDPWTDPL